MNNKIVEIKNFIEQNMGHEYESHNFQHAFRVLNNAEKIMKIENNNNLNKLVVCTSCLVHDFVDCKLFEDVEGQHNKLRSILKELDYSLDDIEFIFDIIDNISYSKGVIPKSIEGKIVQDADRLDALLAFGVLRPFTFGSKMNRPLYDDKNSSLAHYIEVKLTKAELLNTEGAKRIRDENGDIIYIFLAYLLNELPDDIYEKRFLKKQIEEFYKKYCKLIPEKLIPDEYRKES
jgi:uncharacterized protein